MVSANKTLIDIFFIKFVVKKFVIKNVYLPCKRNWVVLMCLYGVSAFPVKAAVRPNVNKTHQVQTEQEKDMCEKLINFV